MGKYSWHNLQVWYCSSSSGTGDTPSLNLATAERDPTLRHPQAALPPLLTKTRLPTAQSPHSSSGKAKAKKAQVERRRWLQGLEGDGPSTMSPPCASPGYLHVE